MTREEFKKLVSENIVILDGATGSNLIAAGMPQGVCPEVWTIENPEAVTRLQKEYAEAGSMIVYAPTFGANSERLKGYGKATEVERINAENVAISKAAVSGDFDVPGGRILVAGDMSMTGMIIYPDDDESFDEAVDVYKEQAEALIKAGVDLFIVETMISLEDARAAVHAIREVCDLPVMVTMSFETNMRTLYGDTPESVAEVLTEEGADAIGSNCSSGPANMVPVIKAMKAVTDLPLIAKPNAGLPQTGADGKVTYDLAPEGFAEQMKELIDNGAVIVGGCCGTTPAYIRSLKGITAI